MVSTQRTTADAAICRGDVVRGLPDFSMRTENVSPLNAGLATNAGSSVSQAVKGSSYSRHSAAERRASKPQGDVVHGQHSMGSFFQRTENVRALSGDVAETPRRGRGRLITNQSLSLLVSRIVRKSSRHHSEPWLSLSFLLLTL